MKDIILTHSEAPDFVANLERSGATWSRHSVQNDDGEWVIQFYDILTADELEDMDLAAMDTDQLKSLLPLIKDLYENIDSTLSEYEEYDEESDLTKEEFAHLHDQLEDKLTMVEEQLQLACDRLDVSFEKLTAE